MLIIPGSKVAFRLEVGKWRIMVSPTRILAAPKVVCAINRLGRLDSFKSFKRKEDGGDFQGVALALPVNCPARGDDNNRLAKIAMVLA
jgi:hypothetical protein